MDTVSDQIKHLKTAVEHTIDLNKHKVRVEGGECKCSEFQLGEDIPI